MSDELKTQMFQALAVLLLVVLCLIFAQEHHWSFHTDWVLVLATLVVLFIVLGLWLTKDPLGILVNERNLMSLSRLQIVCWTLLILSAYIVMVMQRVVHMSAQTTPDPFDVTVPDTVWALLGISVASFVGTPMVLNAKTGKTASSNAVLNASKSLDESPAQIQQNAQGTLYSNANASDARFSDIFQGDEVGNTANIDISKVQMFIITLLLVGGYIGDMWRVLSITDVAKLTALPAPDQNMLKLFALSHAGYLTFKAVGHTDTTNSSQ